MGCGASEGAASGHVAPGAWWRWRSSCVGWCKGRQAVGCGAVYAAGCVGRTAKAAKSGRGWSANLGVQLMWFRLRVVGRHGRRVVRLSAAVMKESSGGELIGTDVHGCVNGANGVVIQRRVGGVCGRTSELGDRLRYGKVLRVRELV